jgi:hypothetical protein
MTKIDENQEAVACIRMAVDASDAKLKAQEEDEDDGREGGKGTKKVSRHAQAVPTPQGHWTLGSPQKRTTTTQLATAFEGNPAFHGFQKSLFTFLRHVFPEEQIDGTALKVCKMLVILITVY